MTESAPGTDALYDFGARSYNPALGAFTSLDSVHGSAQNSALLNGYLYADANPATLVDPDGHAVRLIDYGTDTRTSLAARGINVDWDAITATRKSDATTRRQAASTTTNQSDEWSAYDRASTTATTDATPVSPPPNVIADMKQCAADPTGATQSCVNLEIGGWQQNQKADAGLPQSAFGETASVVLTMDQAAQAGADSAWGSVWRRYYAQTTETLMERYSGMSLEKAGQIAYNLARMNIAKGDGAFLSDLSGKLGVAGAVADATLTFADCQKGLGPCLLKSSVHLGAGVAGVAIGTAAVEGCVEFGWLGPWGCAGAGIIAGGVTAWGLNTVTDTVIDIHYPDEPHS